MDMTWHGTLSHEGRSVMCMCSSHDQMRTSDSAAALAFPSSSCFSRSAMRSFRASTSSLELRHSDFRRSAYIQEQLARGHVHRASVDGHFLPYCVYHKHRKSDPFCKQADILALCKPIYDAHQRVTRLSMRTTVPAHCEQTGDTCDLGTRLQITLL